MKSYQIVMNSDLTHHGIKGQKWGVRRWQNKDGSLTSAGRKRYGYDERMASFTKVAQRNNARMTVSQKDTTDLLNSKNWKLDKNYNYDTEWTEEDTRRWNRNQAAYKKASEDQKRLASGKFAKQLGKETEKRYGKAKNFVSDADMYRNVKTGKKITQEQMFLLKSKAARDKENLVKNGYLATIGVLAVMGGIASVLDK